jgi:hypothetical protein
MPQISAHRVHSRLMNLPSLRSKMKALTVCLVVQAKNKARTVRISQRGTFLLAAVTMTVVDQV